VFAAGTAAIVYGGIRRIAKVADVIVPIMAGGYLLMAVAVILLNIVEVPGLIVSIVTSAFDLEEAIGGGMGAALAQGLQRGLFSNEAGLGSAPNVAATAEVRHPDSQGITQSLSVLIDPMLICTCTAFASCSATSTCPGTRRIAQSDLPRERPMACLAPLPVNKKDARERQGRPDHESPPAGILYSAPPSPVRTRSGSGLQRRPDRRAGSRR